MMPESKKKLVTRTQLAADLDVHVSTVSNWVKARVIPCVRRARFLRFDHDEVVEALKRHYGINAIGDRK
jgi:phage terminase Nu1 subunit (DNA packaging protein)